MLKVTDIRTGKLLFKASSIRAVHRILKAIREAYPGLSVEIQAA